MIRCYRIACLTPPLVIRPRLCFSTRPAPGRIYKAGCSNTLMTFRRMACISERESLRDSVDFTSAIVWSISIIIIRLRTIQQQIFSHQILRFLLLYLPFLFCSLVFSGLRASIKTFSELLIVQLVPANTPSSRHNPVYRLQRNRNCEKNAFGQADPHPPATLRPGRRGADQSSPRSGQRRRVRSRTGTRLGRSVRCRHTQRCHRAPLPSRPAGGHIDERIRNGRRRRRECPGFPQ